MGHQTLATKVTQRPFPHFGLIGHTITWLDPLHPHNPEQTECSLSPVSKGSPNAMPVSPWRPFALMFSTCFSETSTSEGITWSAMRSNSAYSSLIEGWKYGEDADNVILHRKTNSCWSFSMSQHLNRSTFSWSHFFEKHNHLMYFSLLLGYFRPRVPQRTTQQAVISHVTNCHISMLITFLKKSIVYNCPCLMPCSASSFH